MPEKKTKKAASKVSVSKKTVKDMKLKPGKGEGVKGGYGARMFVGIK